MAFRVRFEDAEVDGEVHFLGGEDSFIQQVLCYPRAQCVEAEDRIEALKSDGFEYLIESGKNICGLRVLGRGYRAIVVLAYHKRHGLGSLKILRLDSTKSNLLEEVNMMNRAQPFQLPPKLYSYGDFYIFSELIPVQKCREF
ncbi:MAG: serine/threonine protein kinase, partial [Desulfurococcaceae archaeon]